MKHPSTRGFFAYWDQMRGLAAAPERSALEPDPVRHLLGDSFVLAYEPARGHPFRVTGTRVCALLGGDMKGRSFIPLWNEASRTEIEDILAIAADEVIATVAGITVRSGAADASYLEMLLLPFAKRPHTPVTIAGVIAPLRMPARIGREGLADFTLTSWRHVGHRELTARQRAIRKWQAARGVMVYEGLRGDV